MLGDILTPRQFVAVRMYYVGGWSYREIGGILSCNKSAVHGLVSRAKIRIVSRLDRNDVNFAQHMRELLRPSPNASLTRDLGKAHARQEDLLDALDLHMQRRADQLAIIEECMSGKSYLPVHPHVNRFDQWECRYLNSCGTVVDALTDSDLPSGWHLAPRRPNSVPGTAYRAGRAAKYCAADADVCDLGCKGCRGPAE